MEEKKEHQNTCQQNNKLKAELRKLKQTIDGYMKDNQAMKEKYHKLYAEKTHIVNELQRLSNPYHQAMHLGNQYGRRPLIESYTLKALPCCTEVTRDCGTPPQQKEHAHLKDGTFQDMTNNKLEC